MNLPDRVQKSENSAPRKVHQDFRSAEFTTVKQRAGTNEREKFSAGHGIANGAIVLTEFAIQVQRNPDTKLFGEIDRAAGSPLIELRSVQFLVRRRFPISFFSFLETRNSLNAIFDRNSLRRAPKVHQQIRSHFSNISNENNILVFNVPFITALGMRNSNLPVL